MTPDALGDALVRIVRAELRLSVMIWGPPGIGKSWVVQECARQHELPMVDLRISQLAPTDLRGLPVPGEDRMRWLPPDFLPRDGRGVLFLDELNLAAPAMQAIAQQLVLDRRVGSYVLPDGWFVWAAGNRKSDRAAVFDMPAPLANRFVHFEVEPDLGGFLRFAARADLDARIVAFLAFRPNLLHHVDPDRPAFPSPRSWTMASALLAAGLGVAPAVGEAAGAELEAFVAIFDQLPSVDAILAGEGEDAPFPTEPSRCYALTLALGQRSLAERPRERRVDPLVRRASHGAPQGSRSGEALRPARRSRQGSGGRGARVPPADELLMEPIVPPPAVQVERRLRGSLLRIRSQAPFFGALALFVELRVTTELPTAGTDGRRVYFNPEFAGTLTGRQLDSVLLHELLHAALLHPQRVRGRDAQRWNVAADVVVNGIVASQPWAELPADAIRAPEWEALAVEEIYELLAGHPLLEDWSGELEPDLLAPDAEDTEAASYWRLAMTQARLVAGASADRLHGSLPAGLLREMGIVERPSIGWRQLLWQHLVRTPNDFGAFDRRFVHLGLYLDDLEGESVQLWVAVDTSGSIDARLLGYFLAEVRSILGAYPHIHGSLFYADADLYGPYSIDDPPPPVGGGGTSFVPLFDRLSTDPPFGQVVVVYFTDGHGTFPTTRPTVPVYWVVPPGGASEEAFPFGRVLRVTSVEAYE
jgi:predicted metal-dependent peptidase